MKVMYWSQGTRTYFVLVERGRASIFDRGYLLDLERLEHSGYVPSNTLLFGNILNHRPYDNWVAYHPKAAPDDEATILSILEKKS